MHKREFIKDAFHFIMACNPTHMGIGPHAKAAAMAGLSLFATIIIIFFFKFKILLLLLLLEQIRTLVSIVSVKCGV